MTQPLLLTEEQAAERLRRTERAYTVATLAAEWDCSEGLIRKLIDKGELECFYVGTLIRIRPEVVRQFECRNTPSKDCGEDSRSSGETPEESEQDTGLRPLTALERRLRQGGFGPDESAVVTGPWQ